MYIPRDRSLKLEDLEPGDLFRSVVTSKVHKVVSIDLYWGVLRARSPEGKLRTYRVNRGGSITFEKLTKEETARFHKSLEESGVTEYWTPKSLQGRY